MFESTKYPDFNVKESSNNQYQVSSDFMNPSDREKMTNTFDSVADMTLELQNKAYELGRLRGRREIQEKIDRCIRVRAFKHGHPNEILAESLQPFDDDRANATLILDDGVVL